VVAAALAAGWRPQAVFLREEAADELGERLGLVVGFADSARRPAGASPGAASPGGFAPAVFVVTERVAARISTLETPADAVAVLPLPARRSPAQLPGPAAGRGPLVLYIDGVQDPGNVGTLLRAAAAFGAAAVVTSAGTADLYGPKTVRGAMGALFALPVFPTLPLAAVTEHLPAATVYGLAAHGGAPIDEVGLRRPAVLVVGAERAGLSRAALALVDELVTIALSPASSGVESLNAGVAGAIALYEFSRRAAGASEDPSRRHDAAQEG
jgi:TrmH family RNA methyltransferase